jgi:hypothetical protein
MRTFAESLAAINTVAVEPEREPSRDGIHDLIRAGVSHQFASALQRVLAEDAVAEFSATFQWASNAGPPPRVDSAVEIPAAAHGRIQTVAARLKATTPARTEEEFTGPIIRIERHPDGETGTVTVQGSRNGQPAHVNVNVSPTLLDEAWIWARSRETVYVRSRVHRTGTGLMAEVFDAVEPLSRQYLK